VGTHADNESLAELLNHTLQAYDIVKSYQDIFVIQARDKIKEVEKYKQPDINQNT